MRILPSLSRTHVRRIFGYSSCARSQALVMGVSVWLAVWSEQDKEEQKRDLYVGVLALMVLLAILVSGLRAILTFFSLVKVRCGPRR